jgi:hypothetical protein
MWQRFCILLHDHPWWHWDFLLESGDDALCWRLLRQPCSGEPIAAEQLPPHRLQYLDFEGPVSGNRGIVKSVANGTYQIVSTQPEFTIALMGLDWAHSASLVIYEPDRFFWQFSNRCD